MKLCVVKNGEATINLHMLRFFVDVILKGIAATVGMSIFVFGFICFMFCCI